MISLWYSLPGWKHALFFPPNWHGRACPINSRSIEAWFPGDALMRAWWCRALKISLLPAALSHMNGGPSKLRMLPFPSPLKETISSLCFPLAACLFPQYIKTFYPWRVQDLRLNIFPCRCRLLHLNRSKGWFARVAQIHASTCGLSTSRTGSVQGRLSQTSVACFHIEFIVVFHSHPLLLITPFSNGLKGSYTTQHPLPVKAGILS